MNSGCDMKLIWKRGMQRFFHILFHIDTSHFDIFELLASIFELLTTVFAFLASYGRWLRRWIALLANIPVQAKTQLHSLERAVTGTGIHVNADKTENMCLNQRNEISTLNGSSLKLVDKFLYLGSSVSSTEKDINMRQAMA